MGKTGQATRSLSSWLAPLLIAAVFAGVWYWLIISVLPPEHAGLLRRYFCGHPIEVLTACLFFWAGASLVVKSMRLVAEWRLFGRRLIWLPESARLQGHEAARLTEQLGALPRRLRGSRLAQRLEAALRFVAAAGSAGSLAEHLALLADRDVEEADGSYELVRTITWAIPILGFLGTVVGITVAIGNIEPGELQQSLSQVVAGLAVAFDTTALALALSIMLVLMRFVVERAERRLLARVDRAVEELVLDRFEPLDRNAAMMLGLVESVAATVFRVTEEAWRQQGALWAQALQRTGQAIVRQLAEEGQSLSQRLERLSGQMVQQLSSNGERLNELAGSVAERLVDLPSTFEQAAEAAARQLAQSLAAATNRFQSGAQALCAQLSEKMHTAIEQLDRTVTSLLEAERHALAEPIGSLRRAAAQLAELQAEHAQQLQRLEALVVSGGRLESLQCQLQASLAQLIDLQTLKQTIHSLAAAAHLLTAQVQSCRPPVSGEADDHGEMQTTREAA